MPAAPSMCGSARRRSSPTGTTRSMRPGRATVPRSIGDRRRWSGHRRLRHAVRSAVVAICRIGGSGTTVVGGSGQADGRSSITANDSITGGAVAGGFGHVQLHVTGAGFVNGGNVLIGRSAGGDRTDRRRRRATTSKPTRPTRRCRERGGPGVDQTVSWPATSTRSTAAAAFGHDHRERDRPRSIWLNGGGQARRSPRSGCRRHGPPAGPAASSSMAVPVTAATVHGRLRQRPSMLRRRRRQPSPAARGNRHHHRRWRQRDAHGRESGHDFILAGSGNTTLVAGVGAGSSSMSAAERGDGSRATRPTAIFGLRGIAWRGRTYLVNATSMSATRSIVADTTPTTRSRTSPSSGRARRLRAGPRCGNQTRPTIELKGSDRDDLGRVDTFHT